jgi:hypothetical protein
MEACRVARNTDRMMGPTDKLLPHFGIMATVEGGEFKIVDNSGLINVGRVSNLKYLAEGHIQKDQAKFGSESVRARM